MSLMSELIVINHENSPNIELEIPDAVLTLKSPLRNANKPGGKIRYQAPEKREDLVRLDSRSTEYGEYFELLRCNWPCADQLANTVMITSLRIGAFKLNAAGTKQWNLNCDTDLRKFIVSDIERNEILLAQNLEMNFDEYCKDNYFPKATTDLNDYADENNKWLYAVSGTKSVQFESTLFCTTLSETAVLFTLFDIEILGAHLKSAPDLNEFKHFLVTEYLRHIKIERLTC